ncbi:hypothetical protein [Burkholderia sp. SIMBA_062]|uniref:hypothetical protein n=1 Tax=Burkholderia sp. SIMBA_062 TaxID=3085803 RepID=UPI00397AE92C
MDSFDMISHSRDFITYSREIPHRHVTRQRPQALQQSSHFAFSLVAASNRFAFAAPPATHVVKATATPFRFHRMLGSSAYALARYGLRAAVTKVKGIEALPHVLSILLMHTAITSHSGSFFR